MSLSRPLLLFYALPALPLAALTLPLYIMVPTFYTEVLGLPLAAVGATLLAVRLFDAVNDPLIGWVGDRWRPAFGRRRALFLLSLPVSSIAALMLFWPPEGAGTGYLVIWGAVLSIGYTATLLPYSAWGAELADGYGERARVAAWRETLTLAGTLVAIATPFAIGLDRVGLNGLAALGLAVALATPALGLLAVWRVPEPRDRSTIRLSPRKALAAMAANAPFRRFILAFLLNGLANAIPATLFLYFVSDRLAMPEMRGPLLFVYFLFGIAGVPVALAVSRRIGKHRAWCLAMAAACVVFAAAPLIGPGNLAAFAFVCAATGLALGFDLSLPAAIQADVVDVDTAASRDQRSAAYFAAWSLATKLSLALGVGIAFPLAAAFGFTPGAQGAEPGSLLALAVIYGWVPIVFKAMAIALMWRFPLGEAEQARLRAAIDGEPGAGSEISGR